MVKEIALSDEEKVDNFIEYEYITVIIDMSYMFQNCYNLQTINITSLDKAILEE